VIGRNLVAYPQESWLDVRTPEVRALMTARLDRARDKGFDGVVPTNLSMSGSVTGFEITLEEQLEYSRFLASEAHARGLAVGLAGELEQASALSPYFDFAGLALASHSLEKIGESIAEFVETRADIVETKALRESRIARSIKKTSDFAIGAADKTTQFCRNPHQRQQRKQGCAVIAGPQQQPDRGGDREPEQRDAKAEKEREAPKDHAFPYADTATRASGRVPSQHGKY